MLWYLALCDECTKLYYDKDIVRAIVTASEQLSYSELRPNQRAVVRSFFDWQRRICVSSNWKWEVTVL